MCVLSRGFGGTREAPAATFALRPLPLGTNAEMVLAVASSEIAVAKHGKLQVTLLPSGVRQQVPFDRWHNDVSGKTFTSFDVPADFLDAMRGAQSIEIAVGRAPATQLATGSIVKALDALVPCQDDLLRKWGYDPAVKDRIGTPAAYAGGNLASAFNHGYYPMDALKLDQEGRATVAWTVDATGKAKDCRVLNSSGVKALDLTTCAVILQKARFKPALDHDGKPMATYLTTSVRWSLEA